MTELTGLTIEAIAASGEIPLRYDALPSEALTRDVRAILARAILDLQQQVATLTEQIEDDHPRRAAEASVGWYPTLPLLRKDHQVEQHEDR